MGASMKDIKSRIKSVESTMQITKAMELVSSSKLRRAKERAENARPFFNVLYKTVSDLAAEMNGDETVYSRAPKDKPALYIIIAGDRGLAGGYNANIFRLAAEQPDFKGAKVIVVPAAFNQTTGPAHWELMFRSQSMFHQVFAVGTAPSLDPAASYHAWGHSIITSPWGDVISQMDEKTGGRLTQIDFTQVEAIRQQLPLLHHRREDVYTLAEIPKK